MPKRKFGGNLMAKAIFSSLPDKNFGIKRFSVASEREYLLDLLHREDPKDLLHREDSKDLLHREYPLDLLHEKLCTESKNMFLSGINSREPSLEPIRSLIGCEEQYKDMVYVYKGESYTDYIIQCNQEELDFEDLLYEVYLKLREWKKKQDDEKEWQMTLDFLFQHWEELPSGDVPVEPSLKRVCNRE